MNPINPSSTLNNNNQYEEDNNEVYEGTSPDEIALVNFAKFCGVIYKGYDEEKNEITILYKTKRVKKLYTFTRLNIFDFDNERKCMSVLLEDKAKKRIILFWKGADT